MGETQYYTVAVGSLFLALAAIIPVLGAFAYCVRKFSLMEGKLENTICVKQFAVLEGLVEKNAQDINRIASMNRDEGKKVTDSLNELSAELIEQGKLSARIEAFMKTIQDDIQSLKRRLEE